MNIKVGREAIAEAPRSSRTGAAGARTTRSARSTTSRPRTSSMPPSLIRTGKVFALGIPLDRNGPQTGLFGGRFNPIHQMLATGTDAIAGRQDWNKIRYADDTLNLCVQGATHWDALGHIFYEDKAYNGHDAKLIDASGLHVLGIEHSKSKMVGRGVLLDIARFNAASTGSRTAKASPTTSSTSAPRTRTSRSGAATSSSSAPARWSAASRKASGAAMRAATRRA